MSPVPWCGPADQGTATGRRAAGGAGGPDRRRESVPCHRSHQGRPACRAARSRAGIPASVPRRTPRCRSGKPLLLVRDDQFPSWVILGAIGAERSGWLRKLAAGKRADEMSAEDWRSPRRARRAVSRASRAAGCRARVRRARRRAVCGSADGEAAPRRTRSPRVAVGPGARRATPALPAAAGVCRQCAGRRCPRSAPGSGMEIGRCDEPGLDAGRRPGAARRGAHDVGRREVSARSARARRRRSRRRCSRFPCMATRTA